MGIVNPTFSTTEIELHEIGLNPRRTRCIYRGNTEEQGLQTSLLTLAMSIVQGKPRLRLRLEAKPPLLSTHRSLRPRVLGPCAVDDFEPESSQNPGFNPYCFAV